MSSDRSFLLKAAVTWGALILAGANSAAAAPGKVSFTQSGEKVGVFEAVEIRIKVEQPEAGNPFTQARVRGTVTKPDGGTVEVEGFCDAADGSEFAWRYMPMAAGEHKYRVTYEQGAFVARHGGKFAAAESGRAGPVRVDPAHPYHFIRLGTGEHWFWNSTTTYQLLAWDEETMVQAVDRLGKLGINRIRAAICGRTKDGKRWNEPLVLRTAKFAFQMEPWIAARPDNLEDPGYDVERFNLAHFRKTERLLEECRKRDIVVSVIFYVDGADKGVEPFGKERMGGPDEQRYYRYAIARLAAFPNVMWDVANEYRLFRDDAWAEKMGAFVKECDPYDHTTSTHGHGDFRFRKSPWADYAMYQSWDEHGGYAYMLKNRREQAATGRPMPQVNEEYGYEDHYPFPWGEKRLWPARIGDSRRRLAWEMTMAGGYQTTGERANDGTGAGPDTGGGWVNGRGSDQMTMLVGYRRMKEFFTSFPWWELDPRDDLAGERTLVLAEEGKRYVAYLPEGKEAKLTLAKGEYKGRWYNPRTGDWSDLPLVKQAQDGTWTSPPASDAGDWALLLEVAEGGR